MDKKRYLNEDVSSLTADEEIQIAEVQGLEDYIISNHEEELDAIAFLEESAAEHVFANLKTHARNKNNTSKTNQITKDDDIDELER